MIIRCIKRIFSLIILYSIIPAHSAGTGHLAGKWVLPPEISLSIPYRPDLVADGDPRDWKDTYAPLRIYSDICGIVPDTNDFQSNFKMAWNEQGIFLLVDLIDDSLYEDPVHYWKGDGLEWFLSKGRGSQDILQISVRPGFDHPGTRAAFQVYDHLRSEFLDNDEAPIAFHSRKTSQGYLLEGTVPFELFGIDPQADKVFGAQLYLNDADRVDDPNNFSLPWYPVRESYRNPYAYHSIRLTNHGHPQRLPELRACVVDEKLVRIRIISEPFMQDQRFHIVSGSFRQRVSNTYIKEWTLPMDEILSTCDPMIALYRNHQLQQVLDLGMVKYVYEQNDPPEWFEGELRLFEIIDRYDPPPDSAILFTGSSTIRRWYSLIEDMYPWKVINRGFGGSVMKELNQNIERIVFPYNPVKIIVYEGDNDIARGTKPSAFLQECKVFINHCRQRLPNSEIIFLSIKPSPSRMRYWKQMDRANRMLKDLCSMHEHVLFIDISTPMFRKPGILKNDIYAEDRLHLNDKGYALLRRTILDSVAKSSN
jgi:lysophospholipase L1-like esterase